MEHMNVYLDGMISFRNPHKSREEKIEDLKDSFKTVFGSEWYNDGRKRSINVRYKHLFMNNDIIMVLSQEFDPLTDEFFTDVDRHFLVEDWILTGVRKMVNKAYVVYACTVEITNAISKSKLGRFQSESKLISLNHAENVSSITLKPGKLEIPKKGKCARLAQ